MVGSVARVIRLMLKKDGDGGVGGDTRTRWMPTLLSESVYLTARLACEALRVACSARYIFLRAGRLLWDKTLLQWTYLPIVSLPAASCVDLS